MDLTDLTIQPGKIHLVREILNDGITGSVRVLGRYGQTGRRKQVCFNWASPFFHHVCAPKPKECSLNTSWMRTHSLGWFSLVYNALHG